MKSKKIRGTFTRTRRIMAILLAIALLTSCDVVRTITTTSEAYQTDEKQVVITTKTIEQYTANKK